MQTIRRMGAESQYSALSFLSLLAVLCLHLIHWLSAPLIVGAAAAEMQRHHEAAEGGSPIMGLLMFALFIVNLISMYFAVRQLRLAWKKRSAGTLHSHICSAISLIVLGAGIYTTISL